MSLSNRSFRDNRTGEVVKVIDSFENIAILENKTKIDARRLLDPSFFTEEIDPKAFMNTRPAYDSIFEEIKKMPLDKIPDERGEITPTLQKDGRYTPIEEESAVIYGREEDEREELARKYGINPDPSMQISRQKEAFSKILGEDTPEAAEIAPVARPTASIEEDIQKIEVQRDRPVSVNDGSTKIDPVVTMFKGIKRSVDFSIDVKLENKIPRLDFIEMMEDSYERSIIEYLAEEFTEELIRNPNMLKQSIANKIREMVYEKPKAAKKAPVQKRATKSSEKTEKAPVQRKPSVPRKKAETKKEAEQQ